MLNKAIASKEYRKSCDMFSPKLKETNGIDRKKSSERSDNLTPKNKTENVDIKEKLSSLFKNLAPQAPEDKG